MYKRAFTLVELLIVIAIIGVLASVIFNAIQDARERGVDAKIKGEINLVAKRAAVAHNNDSDYDAVCGSNGQPQDEEVVDLIESVANISGEAVVCNSDSDQFAVSALLGSGDYWCIDDGGKSVEIPAPLGASELACP